METTKLKRFAAESRINLMEGVRRKLHLLGFDKEGHTVAEPELLQGGTLWKGEEYPETFYQQWTTLRDRILERGVREVVEEAAYTWFNRMMAIRILTMNELCEPALRFDQANGLPLLLSDARMGRVPEMSAQERARFDKLMDDDNRTYDQFSVLLTAWCHNNPIIRTCFGSINDYVELLLPDNILRPDGFLAKLNDTPFISEEDYKSAELIGWLYQFYISDRKDEVFAKKGKVEADEIPAATQIFTPNWIVKYMVQNTILPQVEADDEILENAKYLVTSDSVGSRPVATDSRKIDLEDLKVADFACGSGHILNECFDLLFELYRAESYSRREAIERIFTKNLTGIDIDLRAKQLATFALLLKACQKDASFADAHCLPHVISVPQIDKELIDVDDPKSISGYLHHFFLGSETKECSEQLTTAISLLKDADSLGSIIKFDLSPSTRRQLVEAVFHWNNQTALSHAIKTGLHIMDFILTLTDSYDAIVMNPPYMPTSKVDGLKDYAAKNYPDSKTDLFSVFMDVCIDRLKEGGKYGMINMQSWMFLSSFEALREKIIEKQHIDSLLHLGPRTFDELSGEVVQNAAFVISKENPASPGVYFRLIDGKNCNIKKEMFLADAYRYVGVDQKQFEKIPDAPIAYWVSSLLFQAFEKSKISDFGTTGCGMSTSDNVRFLRLWYEVDEKNIFFSCDSLTSAKESNLKWFPYNKGGEARKWYGNNEVVINWYNDGEEIKYWVTHNPKDPNTKSWSRRVSPVDKFFKEALTWSDITTGFVSCRVREQGFIFDSCSISLYPKQAEHRSYIMGFMNTKIFNNIMAIINPTFHNGPGPVSKVPLLLENSNLSSIDKIVNECVSISKQDWDAHEASWDFEQSPLLALTDEDFLEEGERKREISLLKTGKETHFLCGGLDPHPTKLETIVEVYKTKWEHLFLRLHANEEEINRQFIEIYGLEDELTPDVPLEEVTILQQGEIKIKDEEKGYVLTVQNSNLQIPLSLPKRIEWQNDVITQQFISYIVGVYMGRYRLDKPGLNIAHPNPSDEELAEYTFNISGKEEKLKIDEDAIIPVLPQDAPFFDNLRNYVVDFVRKVWGEESLAENINFIEKCLGKNTDDYLMKDFWKAHKKMYQNRPIYWEFASKKGAFRAVVYAHRMDKYTVEVLRSKYLLPYIAFIERKIANLDSRINDLSTKERRELDTLRDKTLPELREYHDRVQVVAGESSKRDPIFDLDDGIIKNHALFGDIVTKLK